MFASHLAELDKPVHRAPRPLPAGLVDFPAAGLPEYADCYAIIVDDLYSRSTLSSFLSEAQLQPQGVDAASGERIIHDSFPISEQIFAELRPHLSAIEEIEEQTYVPGVGDATQKWRMVRLNERLRFLRYPKGGFFKAHEDGRYFEKQNGQKKFYTLQLYLPSDASGSEESFHPALGGATLFWGADGAYAREVCPYADVEALPGPGRALVFQHDELLHSGEEVLEGVKITIRSDILYEKVGKPVSVAGRG
ncbi:hypothetical protein B0H14DRAFT_2582965 [Mycena olivaceomarginata]|nr:hypothetical protein B0H14DRAFT_2582965 [Mycena olivaceomarginata]